MKNRVTSFSGGQTSGFMLRQLLDKHPDYRETFHTIFCNTGREHEKTLDFVHKVETEWEVPVTWLEYRRFMAEDIDPEMIPEGRKRANYWKAAEARILEDLLRQARQARSQAPTMRACTHPARRHNGDECEICGPFPRFACGDSRPGIEFLQARRLETAEKNQKPENRRFEPCEL